MIDQLGGADVVGGRRQAHREQPTHEPAPARQRWCPAGRLVGDRDDVDLGAITAELDADELRVVDDAGRAAADGFVPLYVVTTLLLLAMLALGWSVAPGHRTRTLHTTSGPPRLALPTPWGARIAFTLLALLIGALIVWLPYAWTRAATAHGWDERLLLLLVVLAYRPTTPLSEWILRWRVRRRRVGLAVMFLALVASYVAVPIAFHPSEAVLDQSPRPYTLLLVGYFGAYFTCLLIGWYFLLCLQWNGHGNEAGGAARVDAFRQFIRFRLTADTLTGFVVAIDAPSADPAALRPYIVDVFQIAPEAPGGPA